MSTDDCHPAYHELGTHSPACGFPGCTEPATTVPRGMCTDHRNVTVSSSFVDDRHTEGGHG